MLILLSNKKNVVPPSPNPQNSFPICITLLSFLKPPYILYYGSNDICMAESFNVNIYYRFFDNKITFCKLWNRTDKLKPGFKCWFWRLDRIHIKFPHTSHIFNLKLQSIEFYKPLKILSLSCKMLSIND